MRVGSDNLKQALTGSFSTRLVMDVFYGTTRTMQNVPVVSWEVRHDIESEIKSAGSVTVVFNDTLGKSVTPKQFTDNLAPFGQEVNLLIEVSAGSFSETVQIGHYRIVEVTDARDDVAKINGTTFTVGSRLTLTLQDRFVGLKRAGFAAEQNPPSTASVWSELQRLSGMQVLRSITDRSIPTSVVYNASAGSRLQAIQDLADVLRGVAYMTSDGALSVIPNDLKAVSTRLRVGPDGSILDLANSMDSDGICNQVIGNFEDALRVPITAKAEVTTGPLAVGGPYGTYTKYVTNSIVKTQAAANNAVQAVLDLLTKSRTYTVPVTCVTNPLIEIGDTVEVQRESGAIVTGRVTYTRLGWGPSMDLRLQVTSAVA